MKLFAAALTVAAFLLPIGTQAQENKQKYPSVDELPAVEELPNPFVFFNSDRKVTSPKDWEDRRKELKDLFQHYVYGQIPPFETDTTGEIVSSKKLYGGKATLYHAEIKMGPNDSVKGNVRWIVPEGDGPFPMIITTTYNPSIEKKAIAQKAVERGYIVAEWYLYEYEARSATEVGQIEAAFPQYKTGIIGQWAWSCSACFDYLRKVPNVDPEKILITGNSKSGKTVIVAAAFDDRIPMVVPSCTGICGTGVFRFNPNKEKNNMEGYLQNPAPRALFSKELPSFIGKENQLPIDQHLLTALVAPRPMLIVCGKKDFYDRSVLVQAGYQGTVPVYEWMGVGQNLGFRCHPEGHGYYDDDWYATLDFADSVWFGKPGKEGQFNTLGFPPTKNLFSWTAPDKVN